ncbi:hypothetical protein C8R47DRAFT_1073265 [Mycena vitilis]|nr:hypothetical protein C8R47DRAFT_1073265 [Mycena vitilis]
MWLMTVWTWACGLGLRAMHVSSDEQCAPTKTKDQHRHRKSENSPPSGHHQLSGTDIVENHEETPHENTDQSTALGISRSNVFDCAQDLILLDNFQFGRNRQEPRTGQIQRVSASLCFETRKKTSAPHPGEEMFYIPEDFANKLARTLEGFLHTTNPGPIFTEVHRDFPRHSTGITGSTASSRLQIMASAIGKFPNNANRSIFRNGTNLYLVKWKSITNAVSGFILLQTRREIANTGILEPRKSGKIQGSPEPSGWNSRTFQDWLHTMTSQDAENWEKEMCRAHTPSFLPNELIRAKDLPFTQHESASRKEVALRAVPFPSRIEQQSCYRREEVFSGDLATRKNPNNSGANGKGTRFENCASSKTDGVPRLNRAAGASWAPQIRWEAVWNAKTKLEITPTTVKRDEIIQGTWDLTVIRVKPEWRWRATCTRALRSPGTGGILSGGDQQQDIAAISWKTEIAVAQTNNHSIPPKEEWSNLADSHYGTKNYRLRWNEDAHRNAITVPNEREGEDNTNPPKEEWSGFGDSHYGTEAASLRRSEVAHRYKKITANERRPELKGHDKPEGRPQHTNAHNRNFDQIELTYELNSTMSNLPLPPKPAENIPGKRYTPSSRGRFVNHPPHLIPNPRPSPSNHRVPPIPRPLPSVAPSRGNNMLPPCRILERRHVGDMGPVDFHPREPNAERRMAAATQGQIAKYRQGLELTARPGKLVSPQAMYTGNTGLPAERTGHAEIRLFATPDDDSAWAQEVPFPSDAMLSAALVKYGPFQRRESTTTQPTGHDKAADPPATSPNVWHRKVLPIPKASLARIAAAAAAAKAAEYPSTASTHDQNDAVVSFADTTPDDAASAPMDTEAPTVHRAEDASRVHTLRFLLRPVDQPPATNASGLVRLGNAADSGDNVFAVNAVPLSGGPRYDTPHPPLRLFDSPPALKPIADAAMSDVNDGGEEMEGVEHTTPTRPTPAAAPAVTMPAQGAPASASPGALVFGAFISPAPLSPTISTMATDGMSPPESDTGEEGARSPVVPPARPPTATENSSEQANSNASRLAALELDTPRPAPLALASANLGRARGSLATPVLNNAAAPATLRGKRTLSPIDFDEAELVSTSSGEEGEIREEKNAPGVPSPSRAARLAIPQLGNGKRGTVVTRERFSSSPSFESKPRETRVVTALEENERDTPIRLRETCVAQRTRPVGDAEMHLSSPRNGQSLWVRVSAVRSSLQPEEMLKRDVAQLSSSDEESLPALASPSDSEESSNESESYDFPKTRLDPVVNDGGHSQTSPHDKIIAGSTFVRELAYHLDRCSVAPPAPEVEDNAHGVLLAHTIRTSLKHNTVNRTRRIAEDDHTGQPLRDAFEIGFTHARLVLDHPAIANPHDPVDLEELARKYQRELRNVGAASLAQFTVEALCKVAVPVTGGCFRLAERWATPRTPGGAAFRVFSDWARAQGEVFMACIGLEVARRPGFVAVLTILKICLMEFMRRALLLLQHYGIDLDEAVLHAPAHIPLPSSRHASPDFDPGPTRLLSAHARARQEPPSCSTAAVHACPHAA